jgi:hypothetical protein
MAGFRDHIPSSVTLNDEAMSLYIRMRRAVNTIDEADWVSEFDLGNRVLDETAPQLGMATFKLIDAVVRASEEKQGEA